MCVCVSECKPNSVYRHLGLGALAISDNCRLALAHLHCMKIKSSVVGGFAYVCGGFEHAQVAQSGNKVERAIEQNIQIWLIRNIKSQQHLVDFAFRARRCRRRRRRNFGVFQCQRRDSADDDTAPSHTRSRTHLRTHALKITSAHTFAQTLVAARALTHTNTTHT